MGNGLLGWIEGWICDGHSIVVFLARDGSFYVISNSCVAAQSAEGACDPGGGGGNKFELLDITEE